MKTLMTVLVSATLAACISLAIAGGARPEVRFLPADDGSRGLADRLASIERALQVEPQRGDTVLRVAAAARPVDGNLIRAPIDDRTPDAAIAELNLRLDAIERRLEAVGRDPLTRAYGYLASASPRARREAIELLRRFAPFDPQARDAIRSMLADQDAGVRREAVEAIGRIGDRESLPRVRSLLGDDDGGVRREAAEALEDLLRGLPKGSSELRAGIDALVARAHDANARVREEIVETLGDIGPELASATLVELLDDPESDVRDEAITALGRSGDASVIPHLRRLYESGPASDRLDVAIAMSRLGDRSAFSEEAVALAATAGNMNASDRDRARAVWTLGRVDAAGYRAVLTRALDDPSSRVRRAAERALRRGR